MPFDYLLLPLNEQTAHLDMTPRSLNVLSDPLVGGHRFLQHLRQVRKASTARIVHIVCLLLRTVGGGANPNRGIPTYAGAIALVSFKLSCAGLHLSRPG